MDEEKSVGADANNPLKQWDITVTVHPTLVGLEEITVSNKENSLEYYKVPTTRVHGMHHFVGCKEERWDILNASTRYRPGDIIIASYPKCGTTWSEQSVLLLLNRGDPTHLNPRFRNSYNSKTKKGKIWIEAMVEQEPAMEQRMGDEGRALSWKEFDEAPSPRVIKTHAPIHMLLGCDGKGLERLPPFVKVIVVSRNPLDACVSGYYHVPNPFKMGWSFEAWAATWLSGRVEFGGYFEWVRGWYDQTRQHPNRVLWIQYESMIMNQPKILMDMARYLDVDCCNDTIGKTAQYSSFTFMKTQTDANGGDTLEHLRKGSVGDWKNHCTKEMYDVFADRFHEELGTTDLYFPSFN